MLNILRVPYRLYDGYILTLDDTIYRGDILLPGAHRLIAKLRELRKRVVFISNNPTYDVRMHVDKLAKLGLHTTPEGIVTTTLTTTRWLLQNAPDAIVFPMAEEPLKHALRDAGIQMSENPREIDIVLASRDRSFNYRDLRIVLEAMRLYKRPRLICTNADDVFLLPDGRMQPDTGSITAAIECCTGAKVDVNCGSPGPVMLNAIMEVTGLNPGDCILAADRLQTDIKMGVESGIDTAVVFTGETTSEMFLSCQTRDQPTYALDRIDRLIPPALWTEYGWKVDQTT